MKAPFRGSSILPQKLLSFTVNYSNIQGQLTGTIHDFSLYYNKKYLDKWTSENRIHLMNSSIKRYEADLEELRMMKI